MRNNLILFVLLVGGLVLASAAAGGCNTSTGDQIVYSSGGHFRCNDHCGPRGDKVLVCHAPPGNPDNAHTICVDESAVSLYVGHGDYCGFCGCDTDSDSDSDERYRETCDEPVCGDEVCGEGENCSACPEDCGECPPVCGDDICEETENCEDCACDCGECLPVCGDGICTGAESCNSCPSDCGECSPECGDDCCADEENCRSCPEDCGECPPECGDSVCEGLEDCTSCSSDCGACPPECGDGECNGRETCGSCFSDCGPCPPTCGDNICNETETCFTCPHDCNACPTPDASPEPTLTVTGGGGCSSSKDSSDVEEVLFILGIFLFYGAYRIKRKGVGVIVALFFILPSATPTFAQIPGDPAPIPTERFEVPMDKSSILNVEGADTSPRDSWGLYFWTGYANDSLVVNEHDNGDSRRLGSLVGNSINSSIGGFYSLGHKTQLRIDFPVSIIMDRGQDKLGNLTSLHNGSIGDPKLGVKWKFLNQEGSGFDGMVDAAFGVDVTLPSGTKYFSESKPTITPYLALGRWLGSWRAVLNVGYRARHRTNLANLRVDDEFLARIGVAYGWDRNELGATLAASTSVDGPFNFGNRDYSEIMVGYNRYYYDGLSSFVGAGYGLNEGFGTPDWRVLAGLRWTYDSTTTLPVKCGPLGGTDCSKSKEKVAPPTKKIPVLVVTDTFFSFDKTDIKPKYKALILESAKSISAFVREQHTVEILVTVEGNTDSIGNNEYNLKLGDMRANVVAQALVEGGVPEKIIRRVSHGENNPRATNSTVAGRAENRRVEIYLVGALNEFVVKEKFHVPDVSTYDDFGKLKIK